MKLYCVLFKGKDEYVVVKALCPEEAFFKACKKIKIKTDTQKDIEKASRSVEYIGLNG